MRRLIAVAAAGLLAAPLIVGPAAAETLPLAPHRAGYELTLLSSKGKNIGAATGRIALEFTGTACDGYATNFAQITRLTDTEGQAITSEMRMTSFEGAEGKSLDFRSDKRLNNGQAQRTSGQAVRSGDGGVAISVKEPKPIKLDIDGDVVFPTEHMVRMIEAARKDQRILGVKVYDGSEGGEKVYDTTALLGPEIPSTGRPVEKASEDAGLAKIRRWPVSISYFEPGTGERTPVYVLHMDLFENGVSGALRLDFGDFVLKGEMTRLEMLKPTECAKR